MTASSNKEGTYIFRKKKSASQGSGAKSTKVHTHTLPLKDNDESRRLGKNDFIPNSEMKVMNLEDSSLT